MSDSRRRGAPPGNTNALKHGFYARKFKPRQLDDYTRAAAVTGLDQEIALLRLVILNLTGHCLPASGQPPDLDAISALESSLARLSRLLRDQRLLALGDTDPAALIATLFASANDGLPFTRLFPASKGCVPAGDTAASDAASSSEGSPTFESDVAPEN